jgi:hypothetical protein
MKAALVLASILMAAGPALARPNTTAMTCSKAHSLVQSHGAIVLSTGTWTYDRFVAHQGHCMLGEVTRPAWVPTRDNAQCFVGYTCQHDDRGH